jgi:hypothetical protein
VRLNQENKEPVTGGNFSYSNVVHTGSMQGAINILEHVLLVVKYVFSWTPNPQLLISETK